MFGLKEARGDYDKQQRGDLKGLKEARGDNDKQHWFGLKEARGDNDTEQMRVGLFGLKEDRGDNDTEQRVGVVVWSQRRQMG